MRGGLVVCGTTSDAGKSWVVTGLCRLLARRGVRVAPFKGQNMALNASVTADGGEIGHAQWVQALAAGAEPEVAMNPVLLKPTGERTSQVIVMGRAVGERDAAAHQRSKAELRPVVLAALEDLRSRYDVVLCEGAGGAAEINLLEGDLANLPLAHTAGLPAIVVGDIERGGVFASLFGTVGLLPPELAACVRGFVINRFRGDPALLGDGLADLERRTGVPTLGVVPLDQGLDLDAEDSLAVDRWGTAPGEVGDGGAVLDVAAVRLPRLANFGDLDPLRLEPGVSVRWVRSAAELGRPHLVVLPGSKATRADLDWLRAQGLDRAIVESRATVLAVCAGAQMVGRTIADPEGAEGPPGSVAGLGWLPLHTEFAPDKVLDRPTAEVVDGPGAGTSAAGYRIHHGRLRADDKARPWLVDDRGDAIGWWSEGVCATSLHVVLESDGLRAGVLAWAAERAGLPAPRLSGVHFAHARVARFDRIADLLGAHLDLDRLLAVIAEGAPARSRVVSASLSLAAVEALVPYLRVAGRDEPVDGDLAALHLIEDPDALADAVAATAPVRGSEDPQVLASLWWQGYAYRMAGVTLAGWVVAGSTPDPTPEVGAGVGVARGRPASLVVGSQAAEVADLDDLLGRLFAGHLDRLGHRLRERHRVGERLLWGNAAAWIATCLGAIATAETAPPEVADRVDQVMAALPHDLLAQGGWLVPRHHDYRRTTCCLWWKTTDADGALCSDCSLLPPPEPRLSP